MIKPFARLISLVLGINCMISSASGAAPGTIRFHNEDADTTRISALLDEAATQRLPSPNAWVNFFAHRLLDTPYKTSTIEEQPEMLTVNMEYMDCTTFMENVLALSMAARDRRASWRDVVHNLQLLRYRGGEPDGYASRLHYMSDWIIDNSSRGIVRDYTSAVGNAQYNIKSLDFMSQNREKYPALADDDNFAQVRRREDSFRGHKFPYIKKGAVPGAQLRDGDIVMLTTNIKGLDISHVGFITIVNGKPHLLHASSKSGKVEISSLPLYDYLKKQTSVNGIRVIRLCE